MTRTLVTLLAGTLLAQQAMAAGTSMIPPTDEDLRAIPRIAGERRAPFEAAPQPPRPAAARDRGGLLFVSRGMPRPELVAAIAAARADPSLTLVVRGVLPGETLADAMAAWTALLGRTATPPALLIDPRLFRRYAVAAVPTLVDTSSGAQLRGAVSTSRLAQERQQQTGRDLGRIGPTWPIAEPDLAAVHAQGGRTARPAGPCRGRPHPVLAPGPGRRPAAGHDQQRAPHPPDGTDQHGDLRDHTGRLLLPARSELNPLEQVPLTARILVIDAQDPHELAWAKTQQAATPRHHPPGRQPRPCRRLGRLADVAERVGSPGFPARSPPGGAAAGPGHPEPDRGPGTRAGDHRDRTAAPSREANP